MRDKRFIAEHRGGPLTKVQHIQLILWACKCVENVLPLINSADVRLINAIKVAKEWAKNKASVARSVGHAVATAHMADHSLIAAKYALKAVKLAGGSEENEKKWQDKCLSSDIFDLVVSARSHI